MRYFARICAHARSWREFAKCRFAHFPSFFSVHVDTYDRPCCNISTTNTENGTLTRNECCDFEKKKKRRLQEMWKDYLNGDMRDIGVTEDEIPDRTGWRIISL